MALEARSKQTEYEDQQAPSYFSGRPKSRQIPRPPAQLVDGWHGPQHQTQQYYPALSLSPGGQFLARLKKQ